MARLLAKRPILYLSSQYEAGDELPQNNQEMVELWLMYDSAMYVDDSNTESESTKKAEKKVAKSNKGAQ